MAKLINENGTLVFELMLYPNPTNYHWVKYEITIGPNKENKDLLSSFPAGRILYEQPSLRLSFDRQLFEACYGQEVIQFCYGIKQVLDEKANFFFFEPANQDDFQFMIKKSGRSDFLVSIHSIYFSTLESYNWPAYLNTGIRIDVEKNNILAFVNQLEKEYEEIISKYPKDSNCTR